MSLFGPKPQGQSSIDTRLFGIQVTTACSGRPRPLGWGRFRASSNIIWAGNWQTQTPATGKTKGAGGKGGGQQFNYFVSLIFGLCEGPLEAAPANGQQAGIVNIWQNKNQYVLQSAAETYVIGSTGGGPSPHYPYQSSSLTA